MPAVLTTASQLSCPHQGKVTPLVSGAKLTVSGQAVLLRVQVSTWVPACPQPPQTKDTKVNAPTAGVASKLTAGAEPVVLATLVALTNTGASVQVIAGQSKLTAS